MPQPPEGIPVFFKNQNFSFVIDDPPFSSPAFFSTSFSIFLLIHCGVGKNDENREDCKEAKDRLPVHTRSHEEHRNEWGQESPHRIPHMKQIQILIGTSRHLTDRMIVDDRDHALRDSDQEDHHIKHRDRKSHCKQEEAHRIGTASTTTAVFWDIIPQNTGYTRLEHKFPIARKESSPPAAVKLKFLSSIRFGRMTPKIRMTIPLIK